MAAMPERRGQRRAPLTRERVLRAALALADARGIDALSMRKLGQDLGVEAMSLYNHVANKDDLLDGIVDVVASEFDLPPEDIAWKPALRQSAISVHEALLRHPWACILSVSRPRAGPAKLRHTNAVVRTLRTAGFSVQLSHNALHAIDAHTHGFTLQELSLPRDLDQLGPEVAEMIRHRASDVYPHLAEMVFESDHNDQVEFEFVLDIILDGLERVRDKLSGGGRGG